MLYALGSNGSSQLGVGHSNDLSAPQPVNFLRDVRIKQIACGGNHTLFLLQDNSVLGSGMTEFGRLGYITDNDPKMHFVDKPEVVRLTSNEELVHIVQVSATWSASYFLTDAGEILVCGHGSSGELGLGPGVVVATSPHPIPDFPPCGSKIRLLQSGMGHTVVVLENGEVYGWGKGRSGQLGSPAIDVWQPRKIIEAGSFCVATAACGKNFTCLVGGRESGEILICGLNRRDRFGLRCNAPSHVPNWKSVSASWGSIYILQGSGELLAWGRDDYGQLASNPLPRLRALAAGSEHCLAVSESNEVVAWGWNEHGNCGNEETAVEQRSDTWNTLVRAPGECKLFAGCATSFIEVTPNSSLPS